MISWAEKTSKAMQRKHLNYYQFKIRLVAAPLPVWRRLIVRVDVPLGLFHEILQIAMGWDERLEYRFLIAGTPYTDYHQDWKTSKGDKDAACYTLLELMANPGQRFDYQYGPWAHNVTFEWIDRDAAQIGGPHAYCFSGKRACPPECLSGIEEYVRFVDALEDDLYPQRDELLGKINYVFDPQSFDVRQVNHRLIQLSAELDQVEADLIARRKKNKLVVLRPNQSAT